MYSANYEPLWAFKNRMLANLLFSFWTMRRSLLAWQVLQIDPRGLCLRRVLQRQSSLVTLENLFLRELEWGVD